MMEKMMPTEEQVVEILKRVYDPEISQNVYDLGLIYGIEISNSGDVLVKMTLTTPFCPYGSSLIEDVKKSLKEGLPGENGAEVEIVWDPPWSLERVSPQVRTALGLPDL